MNNYIFLFNYLYSIVFQILYVLAIKIVSYIVITHFSFIVGMYLHGDINEVYIKHIVICWYKMLFFFLYIVLDFDPHFENAYIFMLIYL